MKDPSDIISIPADELFKLVFGADHKALIQFINSVFQKTYDVNADPLSISNTAFVNSKTFDQIYGDFMFSIRSDFYHLEFQTQFDKTMILRIFSYGSAKANETAMTESDEPLIFVFPQPLVIYLEENSNISDELKAYLKVANSQLVEFTVPIIKIWKWPAYDLIEREWYLLIPFTLIMYRKKFERVNGIQKYKDEFIKAYRYLMALISDLSAHGKISRALEGTLYGATKNLANYLNEKYIKDPSFGLEVKTEMAEAFRTIWDDLRDEGRLEERKKAELEKAEILKKAEKDREEAAKRAEEAAKQKIEAAQQETEAAKQVIKLEEQRKLISIRNLKQRQLSNEEIASILDLPVEKVEQVS